MNLWDEEMRTQRTVIDALSVDRRQRLAVAVFEMTLELIGPRFDDLFQPATAQSVRDALQRCRRRLAGTDTDPIATDEYINHIFDLAEADPSPGAYTLMTGLARLVENFDDLDGDDTYEVLSQCYEVIINTERIPRVTIETERANDACRRAIVAQQQLLNTA